MSRSCCWLLLLGICGLVSPLALKGQADTTVDPQLLRELIEQNRHLADQVNAQQRTIDELRSQVTAINQENTQREQEYKELKEQMGGASPEPSTSSSEPSESVRISGETGMVYFLSGPDGGYDNGQFRIDDSKIFLEAPVWKNVYFYTEMDLLTREATDTNFHLGEVYADIENISGQWGQDKLVNLRVGRMYIPFGEEYQVRGIMADPLISHSLTDIWGMDQGIELYGELAKFSYFAAVQDGGISPLHNAHSDKSVAIRAGYDPAGWLHLSASAMSTGHLNTAGDEISALWFANGFFRAIGPAATTNGFWADLLELDGTARWSSGHLTAAGGVVHFKDTNTAADDARRMDYYYIEAVQTIAAQLYGAARFSQIHAPQGYPLAGQGVAGEYFFGDVLTTDLYRLSMGLGYHFGPPLVLKIEFSPEWGQTTTGDHRNQENLFSTELGLKF